ncbi:probable glycerol-3-phosphate acyltransferase 3 [Phragmites australis]|uniref:probable glycerol-3-phosphate acyltransferase 3 n=1 Tax=Phragmites australis TaxID=29695 RepID=UPI002D786891|nr:probable glycerol-3-phosphate acyltransferase 3 [Phragmites australis]
MATTCERFANRALRIHRFVKRNLVAGPLRCLGATTTGTSAAPPPTVRQLGKNALVVDVDALLLKPSPSAAFQPFFLVAVEAGGYVRGMVLLALYPVLRLLNHWARVKTMTMICFCGMRRDEAARIGRAVLPKHFFREAADMSALEAVSAMPKEVKVAAVSRSFPTVMVEAFLKEYVGFDAVFGREVKGGPRYFAGVMEDAESDTEMLELVLKQTEKKSCKYPKPIVFHDGRLAFTPTPAAALAMYIYFPFAVVLATVRIAIYTLLPWRVSSVVAALTGVRVRVIGAPPTVDSDDLAAKPHGGQLYACNHRTLLDPVGIASALGRPVAAVSYSLGRLSEVLSPIPLRRLTRDREEDRRRMSSTLARGDVVVCPEGTTCREPYLLRFSPLFAELASEVTPVAVDAHTSMFYATSTSPVAKCFDSVYFLMNPRPEYSVQFLQPVNTEGGRSSIEVANEVQRVLADALGFEGTALTRKDKYLLLAGNEGVVATKRSKS